MKPIDELKEEEELKAAIEKLIHQLHTGSVRQKCEAADTLAPLGSQATQATEALVAALSDMGEEEFSCCGWTGGGCAYYYVRESAANALARINPSAAAPRALQVIAELTGKPSLFWVGVGGEGKLYVSFSDKTIEAFNSAIAAEKTATESINKKQNG